MNISEFVKSDAIQISSTIDGWFIYCFLSEITIGNVQMKCPNSVIGIPENSVIKIANKTIGSEMLKVSNPTGYSSSLNHLANLDMFRNMPSFYSEFDKKIKSDITEIEKDNKEVEKAFSEESFWEQAKDYGFYIMIGIICIGIVMVIFLFKKSKKNIFVRQEEINLREID
jgi:hypothetical protein